MIKKAFPNDLIVGEEDQAESPKGEPGEDFPAGSIWCVGAFSTMTTEKRKIFGMICCQNLNSNTLNICRSY